MATPQPQKAPKHRFPRKLGRFINLEGGLYGQLDMVAITADLLELQTGEDFVRFDRAQATNLRDTIDKFLTLDKAAAAADEPPEVVEVYEEVEAMADVSRPKRPRRGSRTKSA
jgi:hypothetical protein